MPGHPASASALPSFVNVRTHPPQSPDSGGAAFQDVFRQDRVQAKDGRSLKDVQLLTRLFKYPRCYMIYSKSLSALPLPVKSAIYERLFNILTCRDQCPEYAHLSASERKHIFEILVETKPDLPECRRAPHLE